MIFFFDSFLVSPQFLIVCKNARKWRMASKDVKYNCWRGRMAKIGGGGSVPYNHNTGSHNNSSNDIIIIKYLGLQVPRHGFSLESSLSLQTILYPSSFILFYSFFFPSISFWSRTGMASLHARM